MALVDANYKFIYIDVGSNGRASDGGVYRNSSLSQALEEGSLNIPYGRKLLGDTNAGPMTIVADDAFPLRSNIMKPYLGRGLNRERYIFNYRLSRARRVVENAFGILSNRFRLFHTVVALSPAKTELAVLATCVLHNYLKGDEPENMFDRAAKFTLKLKLIRKNQRTYQTTLMFLQSCQRQIAFCRGPCSLDGLLSTESHSLQTTQSTALCPLQPCCCLLSSSHVAQHQPINNGYAIDLSTKICRK